MTSFPLERGEVRTFVPPSLANLPNPPAFTLKPATRREKRTHRALLRAERLTLWGEASVRAEILRALAELWSADLFAESEPRLRAYWDALDFHRKDAPYEPFIHPDEEHVGKLVDDAMRAWPQLGQMDADNQAFAADSPALMASCLITGWSNLDLPFQLVAGVVPLDRMDMLSDALAAIEEEYAGKIEGLGSPGTAFLQLCGEAASLLYLTETERKNSASLSPSTSTPATSTENGPETTDGQSMASPTTETPAT